MLAFSGLASKFNKLIGCHFTRVLYKYNTLEPCQDAVICSLNSSTDSKQSYLLYSCICTAVNSQGWHCHICMLSNLLCSCIWSAPYMLQTLQEMLPILVPTTLALWSSYSSLEMASSAAFEYWLSRFLPETLHGWYVAVRVASVG